MAETNETIDDIIAEMRAREDIDGGDMVDNFDIYSGEYGGWDALMLIKAYADRFDAAHKRERGDCAKLREALKLCLRGMCGYCRMDAEARGMTTECVNGCEVMLGAKAALAATEQEGGAK